VEKQAKPQDGVTAFLIVPLDHDLPNVIVPLHPTASMKVGPEVEFAMVDLLQIVSDAGFCTVGVVADGDPGNNAWRTPVGCVW
jgi:hypothetical protein